MEKALSHLTVLPSTRQEREIFVNKCIEEIANGEQNPLLIEIQLKNLEETISLIRKSQVVKDCVRNEADKYHEKTFEVYGAKITKVERREWDYSETNDSVLARYESDLAFAKERIKERQKFLQAIKPGFIVVDEQTGEPLNPPKVNINEILQVVIQ